MQRSLVILVAFLTASTARADANADVTKAFSAFIEGVAKEKADFKGVDVFITPESENTNDDDGTADPVPTDYGDTSGMIAATKLKVTKVVVSKGGKSAWIAGEIAGKVKRKGKARKEPIRVSAFLFADDKGWHVQAAHWSTGEPDVKAEMCGALDEWRLRSNVPAATQATVKGLYDALVGGQMEKGVSPFSKLLSDDKNAVVIGSAPKEVFVGGAKIKGIFKKWRISAMSFGEGKMLARAAVGPDSEMMWVAMGVIAPEQFCTSYRTLFVLAKEAAGWRIVHHHYSSSTNTR